MKSLIKWAGGKTQLLSELKTHITRAEISTGINYIEPFFGGGALFFDLEFKNAWINDTNVELVDFYLTIRDNPDDLYININTLNRYAQKAGNLEIFYYQLRKFIPNDSVVKAARFWYLNQCCFNGLYRVNKKGEFNVPFNKRTTYPSIDSDTLIQAKNLLKSCRITSIDAIYLLKNYSSARSLIYVDPPYVPLTANSFTSYTANFDKALHEELPLVLKRLSDAGHIIIASNSNCQMVKDLYADFNLYEVEVRRSINSNGQRRKGTEIIITNF